MSRLAALAGCAAALILAGCAHRPSECASPCLASSLQCRAALGDKLAQLELGVAFEEGQGVAVDLKRAASLYRSAAAPISGTTYIYSPPVGKEKAGRVIPVRVGPDRPGLVEAKVRLARLYLAGRGVKLDRNRAAALLGQAARAGSEEATALLADLLPQ